MTSVSMPVPAEVADKIQRMRRAGHGASLEPAPGLSMVMACRACDTNVKHYADVIVNVILANIWTYPAETLDGWATPCCWAGLADCLEEVEHYERFEAVKVEVPVL
jgi:hypothetical protein